MENCPKDINSEECNNYSKGGIGKAFVIPEQGFYCIDDITAIDISNGVVIESVQMSPSKKIYKATFVNKSPSKRPLGL